MSAVSETIDRLYPAQRDLPAPVKLLRPRGFFDRRAEPAMFEAFERALRCLADAGAEVVERPDDAFGFERLLTEHRVIMAAEAAALHESRFAEYQGEYAPHIKALVEEGLSVPVTRYARAVLDWRSAGQAVWSEAASGFRAVVAPATVGPAPDTTTTGNPSLNAPFSYLGWPVVSFPIGLSPDGLPLAVQLAANDLERTLLWTATWCESVIRRASEAGGLQP
jgi:aspartyl-tRNA(Asn)/glutamyl-tRNA(Gln) amidotransferase subunit A